jgi:hypothetical protein
MRRAPAVALAALQMVSCGAPLMTLPAGPGAPASDAERALVEATTACRGVSTMSAEVAVAGSVGGRKVPRSRLLVGLAAPASARIEAPAPFGAPVFVLVADASDAPLLFERENRVLEHGSPQVVFEALTGIPIGLADLAATLTGCPRNADARGARQVGDDWLIVPDEGGVAYLRRAAPAGAWQVVAVVHRDSPGADWRSEYAGFQGGLPRAIRLAGLDARRFDLHLSLSQVDINVPLAADVFRVRVPASAQPISIDDLRQREALGAGGARGR